MIYSRISKGRRQNRKSRKQAGTELGQAQTPTWNLIDFILTHCTLRREQEASGGRLTQEGNGFHLLTVKTRSCLLFIASQFYLKHLSKVAMILTIMIYIRRDRELIRGGVCLKT